MFSGSFTDTSVLVGVPLASQSGNSPAIFEKIPMSSTPSSPSNHSDTHSGNRTDLPMINKVHLRLDTNNPVGGSFQVVLILNGQPVTAVVDYATQVTVVSQVVW